MSPPFPRSRTKELRQSVVKMVLEDTGEFTDVPAIRDFRESKAKVEKQLRECQQRLSGLMEARATLNQLEIAHRQKQKELTAAEAALHDLHLSLGRAAFVGHLANNLPDQPLFTNRKALDQRIRYLETESERLKAPGDVGMVAQAKAKAQQLALAAKIKVQQLSIKKLDTAIGRQLLESGNEESVRCQQTENVLTEIQKGRSRIGQGKAQTEEAQRELESKRQEFQSLLRLSVDGPIGLRALDAEIAHWQKEFKLKEGEPRKLAMYLVDRLLSERDSITDIKLGSALDALRLAEVDEQANLHKPKLDKGLGFKLLGAALVVIGGIFFIGSCNMDTTVSAESGYLRSERIHNVGLMNDRLTYVVASGITVLVGAVLFCFGTLLGNQAEAGKPLTGLRCPKCNGVLEGRPQLCKHCRSELQW